MIAGFLLLYTVGWRENLYTSSESTVRPFVSQDENFAKDYKFGMDLLLHFLLVNTTRNLCQKISQIRPCAWWQLSYSL